MGATVNFQDFGNEPAAEGSGIGRPPGNFPLVRQSSVYSLTFGEFQSTLGKDFGSMNMDELLKNIWSAEETQNVASTAVATSCSGVQNGGSFSQGGYNLQRQGSLTLPRTLSQKTVDEVWRDMAKEYGTGKDAGGGAVMPQAQRQPTLGEITLEEFLVKAGVVREDAQIGGKPNPGGFVAQPNNIITGFGISFQQPNHGAGLRGSRIAESNALQSPNLPLNGNGVRSSQYQSIAPLVSQHQQQQQQQQQQIFLKHDSVSYAPPMAIPIHSSSQLASPVIRPGISELANPTINGNLANRSPLQGGGMGILGMGSAGNGSPANLPSNGLKSNRDTHTPSLSPVPYMFNGGPRGRKSSTAMEKVIERRHRRMIKNRESAARSRQRKQAYTTELEQEVAKLKEDNEELRKKQAQIMEMQENQALEMMDAQYGAKRRCLRRTHTGPW